MSTPDLSTTYMGLRLSSPLVVSSCPLTGNLASARRLEDAGAGAIVLPSLFQEQIEHEELELGRMHEFAAESFPEAASYLPDFYEYNTGPDGYLELVEAARGALGIPVIASLNGISSAGWERYARLIESAGADAIEMNTLFVPTDPEMSADEVEALCAEEVRAVTRAVGIPVAVKIGAQLSAPANFAARICAAGAAGLVLFNRFPEPDIDLETMEVVPRLELSRSSEMRASLRWTAIISASSQLSLASTSGTHGAEDAIKLLLAGTSAVMVASAVLLEGPDFLRRTLAAMRAWLVEHEFESVTQLKGSMNHVNCPNPDGFGRMNYMKALMSYSATQP